MRERASGWEWLGKLLLALAVIFSVVVLVADVASAPAAVSSGHSHGEIATPAHSTLSVAFALLGPVVLVAGLILSYPDSVRRLQEMALVAGLTLLYVDGVLHWLAVLEHLREAVSAAFFIVSGAVQVGAIPSSVVIRKLQEKLLWFVGVVLTVFFIELYMVAVFVVSPFSLVTESVESLGILSKSVEFILLGGLAVFFGRRIVPASLRDAIVGKRTLTLLFLGIIANILTTSIEGYLYWWLLNPRTVLLSNLLVIGLTALATLAYYLRAEILVGFTWSLAALIIILHGVYAINYVYYAGLFNPTPSLPYFPLLLCTLSGGLLSASVLDGTLNFVLRGRQKILIVYK